MKKEFFWSYFLRLFWQCYIFSCYYVGNGGLFNQLKKYVIKDEYFYRVIYVFVMCFRQIEEIVMKEGKFFVYFFFYYFWIYKY